MANITTTNQAALVLKTWQPKQQLSLQSVLLANENGIASLRKEDYNATVAKVTGLLLKCMSKFNVSAPMTPDQIADCATEIVNELWYFKLDDIDLCLRMASRGEFGETYNRIDMPVVFGWFKKYREKRDETAGEMSRGASKANNIYEVLQDPVVLDALRMTCAKLDANRPEEQTMTPRPERHPLVIQIEDEFAKGKYYAGSMAVIDYNGNTLTLEQYYNERFNEMTQ